MSDLEPTTPVAAAGAAETPGEGGQSGEPATTPKDQEPSGDGTQFVTLEDAKKLADDAAEKVYRKAQSYSDQGRAAIEAVVEETREAIGRTRDLGKEISPEEEQAMIGKARAEAIANPPPGPDAAEDGLPQVNDGLRAEFYTRLKVLYETHEVELVENDPELPMLNAYTGDPKSDAVIAEKAILAKKARLKGEPTTETPAANSARVPSSTGAVTQGTDLKSSDRWKEVRRDREK